MGAGAGAGRRRAGARDGADGTVKEFTAIARIDTPEELVAFRHGGILPYVLRQLVKGTDELGLRISHAVTYAATCRVRT